MNELQAKLEELIGKLKAVEHCKGMEEWDSVVLWWRDWVYDYGPTVPSYRMQVIFLSCRCARSSAVILSLKMLVEVIVIERQLAKAKEDLQFICSLGDNVKYGSKEYHSMLMHTCKKWEG